MMLTTALLLAVSIAWLPTARGAPAGGADTPNKLEDAFDIWMGKEAGSCVKYYDRAVQLGKGGGKVLNDQWDQIIDMNAAALDSLAFGNYDESITIRNHVQNFFGMSPWKTSAGTVMVPPARGQKKKKVHSVDNTISRQMYEHIKLWSTNIDGYIKRRASGKSWAASAKKPNLACGSEFMHPVTPDDFDRDKSGKPTKKKLKDTEGIAKLFESNYVFWLDAPFNTHWAAPKETLPNPESWPKDSSGNKHYCAAPDSTALTLLSKSQPLFKAIVVCPQALGQSSGTGLPKPVISEQPKDKSLDAMGVQSLHLYREMFKLFHGEVFVLDIQEEPRDRQVYIAATKEKWPDNADTWKLAGTKEKPVFASTGIDALWLTVHDRSTVQDDVKSLDALNSPANFVWYALVNFMSSKTGQDWSTGRPRPAKSAWMLPFAKSKNSPGPLWTEAELKQISKKHLSDQGILSVDSSDADGQDESGDPGRSSTTPGAVNSSNKGKVPAARPQDPKKDSTKTPRPAAVAKPPKAPAQLVPPKAGGAGTQFSTGGASGQIIKPPGSQGQQTGQQSSPSTSSGSESESE